MHYCIVSYGLFCTALCCVVLIRRLTKEGETIPLCKYPLDLETETCRSDSNSFVFLVWPATVVHRINRSSPLWDVSAEQMLTEQFEIIIILEGTQVMMYHIILHHIVDLKRQNRLKVGQLTVKM